jgi:hypothetical protein
LPLMGVVFARALSLHGEIGVEVYLSCVDGLVPQPESNDRTIYSRLEQFHSRGVPQSLLDQFGVGVYILGPRAKLRVQRSERLFFHPTTMTSQMLPDYAESLRRKTAQLADVVEVFGMSRNSA